MEKLVSMIEKILGERQKRKFFSGLNESMERYCAIYKAKDGKWYMDLAQDEYEDYDRATTYGPFPSEDAAEKYLDNFSNPGGWTSDDSGKRPVPKKSPNGSKVVSPRSSSSHTSSFGRFRRQW